MFHSRSSLNTVVVHNSHTTSSTELVIEESQNWKANTIPRPNLNVLEKRGRRTIRDRVQRRAYGTIKKP